MTLDKVHCELRKDAAVRRIKVINESEGHHFLVETIDKNIDAAAQCMESPTSGPAFSWRHFSILSDAEADARAQYRASLEEGFRPVP